MTESGRAVSVGSVGRRTLLVWLLDTAGKKQADQNQLAFGDRHGKRCARRAIPQHQLREVVDEPADAPVILTACPSRLHGMV